MTLKGGAKFEEKLPLTSKNDMRNFVNFHPTTRKSETFIYMSYFCLKKYRGVIFHDTDR